MGQRKQRGVGLFMLLLVNFIWTGSFPAIAIAVSSMSPVCLTVAGAPLPVHMNTSAVAALLYLSLGAMAVAYLLWQLILNCFEVSYAGGIVILFAVFLGQQGIQFRYAKVVDSDVSL